MILRGVGVRILADDVKTLYDFYTEKLGFKVFWGDRNGQYVAFSEADKNEYSFALFAKTGMADYNGYVPLYGTQKSDTVVLTTGLDDIDGYYEHLKELGVELLGQPQDIPGWQMRCFYFRDPEGNLFEVAGKVKGAN